MLLQAVVAHMHILSFCLNDPDHFEANNGTTEPRIVEYYLKIMSLKLQRWNFKLRQDHIAGQQLYKSEFQTESFHWQC